MTMYVTVKGEWLDACGYGRTDRELKVIRVLPRFLPNGERMFVVEHPTLSHPGNLANPEWYVAEFRCSKVNELESFEAIAEVARENVKKHLSDILSQEEMRGNSSLRYEVSYWLAIEALHKVNFKQPSGLMIAVAETVAAESRDGKE